MDAAKKFFVLNIKGYDHDKMCVATMLCEGSKEEQEAIHKSVTRIAKKYHGMVAGAEAGIKGYLLTYLIAYCRDFAYDYGCSAESFETSVSWSNVSTLIKRVDARLKAEARKEGITQADHVWVSFRVT